MIKTTKKEYKQNQPQKQIILLNDSQWQA